MGKPFSADRLAAIRRMRKARRLNKVQPLFAFDLLCSTYPGYTYEMFLEDLRRRSKPKKKRKGKSPLMRYGRYARMQKMKSEFLNTGEIKYALKAEQLRRKLTHPYRLQVQGAGENWEYTFSALIEIQQIESLALEVRQHKTREAVNNCIDSFRKYAHTK